MAQLFLVNIDLGGNQLISAVIQGGSSDPGTGKEGQLFYNTASHVLKVCTAATPTWTTLGAGGAGTVTTASVVSANGFAGTVASATTTPAFTLSTTVTGMIKGDGTSMSAATPNTDYLPPASPTMTGTPVAPTAGAGTNTTQVATTAFVTAAVAAAVQGLNIKNSAVAATTGAETFTILTGNVTVIAGTTVDGQSPAIGDYVLVKDAPASTGAGSAGSTQPGNGLYQVTNATTNLTVSRAADMTGAFGPAGAFVFVEGGTVSANAGYVVSVPSTNAAFTYGTNNIKWQQFSGAGEITPGTALGKTGNTLNVTTVPIANGGTGQTAQGAALDAIAGAVTSGTFARGNGTHVTMQAPQAADIPTNAAVTPASPGTNTKYALVYSSGFTLGNASLTTITVTHNLNNANPAVTVWNASGVVICDVASTGANSITLTFAVAPASNAIACTVVG